MSEQNDSKTNVQDFIGELNSGILINQLGLVLSEADQAANAINKITIEAARSATSEIGEEE